jgi:hypothetical protein
MTVRSKTELTANTGILTQRIPDNNAGQISAADVRTSMIDIVDSINQIVASGNFNSETPFVNNVRLQKNGNVGGILYVGSGIDFINGGGMQYVPYPGLQNLQHNSLGGLTAGDPHTQYLKLTGDRKMEGGLGMGSAWINSSGAADVTNTGRGLQFGYVSPTAENVNVGSGTSLVYLKDKSRMSSARGVAKAWINFDASGVSHIPVVRDSFGVSGINKDGIGKFTITFHSGILADNNYAAIGCSNARGTSVNNTDFQTNTVGLSYRSGNDASSLRKITFCVQDDGGQYVDADLNDLVIYGTEPSGSGSPPVTVTVT